MNNIVTSKEDILKASMELIKNGGIKDINIRKVAEASNIAVGSVYNYFKSKDDLIKSIIESVWFDIFHGSGIFNSSNNFLESIEDIINKLENGNKMYPQFFYLHSSMMMNKDDGVKSMQMAIDHIKKSLYNVLINDKDIRSDAFDENFTREKLIDTVFSLIMSSMMKGDYDSFMIKEIIKRAIY